MAFKKDAGFFDIVSYTGNAANTAINHALSAAPEMIICVNRTDAASADWPVYHVGMDATVPETYYMFANQNTGRSTTFSTYWNDTAPSSTQFTVGTNNASNGSGDSMIAYLWKGNADYASFGSYTGNSNAAGPIISGLAYQPYVLMIKSLSFFNWELACRGFGYNDTPSDTYRLDDNASSTAISIQFNSDGFQIKSTDSNVNLTTASHIYCAFKPRYHAGYWTYDSASTLAATNFVVPPTTTSIKRATLIGNGGQGQASTAGGGGHGGGGGAKSTKANHTVTPNASLTLSVGGNNSTTNTVFDTITAGYGASGALGGAKGTASGGDTNTDGTDGAANSGNNGGNGGNSGSGATGGAGGIGGAVGAQGGLNGGGGGGGGTDGVSAFNGGTGRCGSSELIW